ncbi:MAG: hypothetical protein LUH05_01585, partial [Candidatus Gastranaerophilales bacterium]|nr:hypothetical protein [Candidatus Gastranaerophilales bacterium]
KKRNQIISEITYKKEDYKKSIEIYSHFIEISEQQNLNVYDYFFTGLCCYHLSKFNFDYLKNYLFWIEKALELYPESRLLLNYAMSASYTLGNYAEAKKCFDKSIKLGYIDKNSHINIYCAIQHRKKEYWMDLIFGRKYEGDYKKVWTGKENLSNSILLVELIGGYGDNILIYGYMQRLVRLSKKVIFLTHHSLYELLKDNELGVEVYSRNSMNVSDIKYDRYIISLFVPEALKVTEENISVKGGYIKANEKLVKKYKEKYFNTDKLKIAVSYKGAPYSACCLQRDIPIEKLSMLDNLDNVQFYCFDKDVNEEELKFFKRNSIINLAKEFSSFADTAAALANVDIVVTSDNCILHLAGALGGGKKRMAIALFNHYYVNIWYDLSGGDCGWYKNVYPIVNEENNNWDISMKKTIDLIKNYQQIN